MLDKVKEMWYNSRAVRERGLSGDSERSLKIEQQERSTKHSMCETLSRQRVNIYSNKVKEAKINSSKDYNRGNSDMI